MTRMKQAAASCSRAEVLSYDPRLSSDLGASMPLSLHRGATLGGSDALWQRTTIAGFVVNGEPALSGTLKAEFHYDFSVPNRREIGATPAKVCPSVVGEACAGDSASDSGGAWS